MPGRGPFPALFARNGLAISLIAALSVAAFIFGFAAFNDRQVLFGIHTGPGAFYKLMPHNAMAALFGAAFLYAIVALVMGVRAFWRDIGEPIGMLADPGSLWQAMKDAGELRYLDGGGVGCVNEDERPSDLRKIYHHFTFYGFLLCFASTVVATLYHYLFGARGALSVVGPAGGAGHARRHRTVDRTARACWRKDGNAIPRWSTRQRTGMDVAFIVMLFLTSLTGIALLLWRDTAAMGPLLALHLGVVFALFITMPYGKFVHGIYRYVALVRYAEGAAEGGARRFDRHARHMTNVTNPPPRSRSPPTPRWFPRHKAPSPRSRRARR